MPPKPSSCSTFQPATTHRPASTNPPPAAQVDTFMHADVGIPLPRAPAQPLPFKMRLRWGQQLGHLRPLCGQPLCGRPGDRLFGWPTPLSPSTPAGARPPAPRRGCSRTGSACARPCWCAAPCHCPCCSCCPLPLQLQLLLPRTAAAARCSCSRPPCHPQAASRPHQHAALPAAGPPAAPARPPPLRRLPLNPHLPQVSYYHRQVKIAELPLDSYRMLQVGRCRRRWLALGLEAARLHGLRAPRLLALSSRAPPAPQFCSPFACTRCAACTTAGAPR
jgi:hypothetical protein